MVRLRSASLTGCIRPRRGRSAAVARRPHPPQRLGSLPDRKPLGQGAVVGRVSRAIIIGQSPDADGQQPDQPGNRPALLLGTSHDRWTHFPTSFRPPTGPTPPSLQVPLSNIVPS